MNKEGGLVWSRWWKCHPEGTKKTSPWGYTAIALWPFTGPADPGSPSSLLSLFWYLDVLLPVFFIVTLRSPGVFYRQPCPTTLAASVGSLCLSPNPLFPLHIIATVSFTQRTVLGLPRRLEAATASETLVAVYQAAWCHIPGGCNFLCYITYLTNACFSCRIKY